MTEPAVSVVVIFHDEERFLAEAMASVLTQDGVDLELILVDDGSTDSSSDLARRCATEHADRVRYVTHPGGENRGMSASRNLGLAESTGTWVTFLDADDVWLPGKLRDQLDVLDAHPEIDVLVSPAQWWRSWDPDAAPADDWLQPLGPERPEGSGPVIVEPPGLVEVFVQDEWRSLHDLLIRRSVLARTGTYEPEFVAMFEDQVFHAKVLCQLRAVVTDDWWYRYRQHPDACTARSHRTGGHLRARRTYLRWLRHHLASAEAGADDLDRLRALVGQQLRQARRGRVRRVARAARRLLVPGVGS